MSATRDANPHPYVKVIITSAVMRLLPIPEPLNAPGQPHARGTATTGPFMPTGRWRGRQWCHAFPGGLVVTLARCGPTEIDGHSSQPNTLTLGRHGTIETHARVHHDSSLLRSTEGSGRSLESTQRWPRSILPS